MRKTFNKVGARWGQSHSSLTIFLTINCVNNFNLRIKCIFLHNTCVNNEKVFNTYILPTQMQKWIYPNSQVTSQSHEFKFGQKVLIGVGGWVTVIQLDSQMLKWIYPNSQVTSQSHE